jgi:hypothetical protein
LRQAQPKLLLRAQPELLVLPELSHQLLQLLVLRVKLESSWQQVRRHVYSKQSWK